MDVYLSPPPKGLDKAFAQLFTPEATTFISDLVRAVKTQVEQLHTERRRRSEEVKSGRWQPLMTKILTPPLSSSEDDWTVNSVPEALQDRRVDLGDVSPTNLKHFSDSLCADVQGIQVDFDDGHCPTWRGGVEGHRNVRLAVHNQLLHVPRIENAPVIMFRPRAWNMTEYNMMVDGEAVPGPLFDYGLHMFHNAKKLFAVGRGPFLYLSKVESATEAEIWDHIFEWTEQRLEIPIGSVKACVLIEDILAAFEMDNILWALRRHSAGLNCGIWDYCASIVARFGRKPAFLLPDRNKYVNMDKTFLKNYLELTVRTCRRRGTCATGGMAALMPREARIIEGKGTEGTYSYLNLYDFQADSDEAVEKVMLAKRKEIEVGVSGFMIYDIRLISSVQKLWADMEHQNHRYLGNKPIRVQDLLEVPVGGVTREGLDHNVRVALLFIRHWMGGRGHFIYRGAVEDSATAEISRWQVCQWLTHQTKIEETEEPITFHVVLRLVSLVSKELSLPPTVIAIYLRLLTVTNPPQFITTFLSDYILLPAPPTTSSHL